MVFILYLPIGIGIIIYCIYVIIRDNYQAGTEIGYDGNLYLSNRNGARIFSCKGCSFKEEAFGLVHGFGSPRWCKVTLQC